MILEEPQIISLTRKANFLKRRIYIYSIFGILLSILSFLGGFHEVKSGYTLIGLIFTKGKIADLWDLKFNSRNSYIQLNTKEISGKGKGQFLNLESEKNTKLVFNHKSNTNLANSLMIKKKVERQEKNEELVKKMEEITIYNESQVGAGLSGNYDNETFTLTISGDGNMNDWSVSFSVPWSKERQKIKYLIIGEGIRKIGSEAFRECKSLINASIPSSVTIIGSYAFFRCQELTSVTGNPSVLTIIGDYAFCYCSKLSSITIASSVKTIGIQAFEQCHEFTSVIIPSSVTSIGIKTFNYCKKLKSIIVESSNQFYSNDSQEMLYDKDQTTLIACGSGKSGVITIPLGVTTIENNAFYQCSGLTSVTIGITSVLATIGECAFLSCTKLSSITIPSSVKTIKTQAFRECNEFTSVIIPSSVESIGSLAFYCCKKLKSIIAESSNQYYSNDSQEILYDKDQKKLIACGSGKSGAITIPSTVTTIESNAFALCSGLTSVTIPSSVETIGSYAFTNCDSIRSVAILSDVGTIENRAFSICGSLRSVVIFSVGKISSESFNFCNALTSVTFLNNVTHMERYAFNDCKYITSVKYCGTKDPTFGEKPFDSPIKCIIVTNNFNYSTFCNISVEKSLDENCQFYKTKQFSLNLNQNRKPRFYIMLLQMDFLFFH